jgi:hypothetical protein
MDAHALQCPMAAASVPKTTHGRAHGANFSHNAVHPRRPMLLPPPLLEKASAAKPSHSVRAPEAAANARVAPCEKGCWRPRCRPPGSQTRSSRDIYSSRTLQLPQTTATIDSRSLGERPPGCRRHHSPPLHAEGYWLYSPMIRVPQRTNRIRTPMPPPAGIPCRRMSSACRAVCPRFPPGPHGRVSYHAAETHCDRLIKGTSQQLFFCYFFCYFDFFYHLFVEKPLKGRVDGDPECCSAASIRAPLGAGRAYEAVQSRALPGLAVCSVRRGRQRVERPPRAFLRYVLRDARQLPGCRLLQRRCRSGRKCDVLRLRWRACGISV